SSGSLARCCCRRRRGTPRTLAPRCSALAPGRVSRAAAARAPNQHSKRRNRRRAPEVESSLGVPDRRGPILLEFPGSHENVLPGYGYARVPQPLRAQWESLVGAYLRARSALVAVVVVMDARHPLTPLDLELIEWLGDVPLLVLLSKADKLTRAEQAATLTKVGSLIRAEVRLFSSAAR